MTNIFNLSSVKQQLDSKGNIRGISIPLPKVDYNRERFIFSFEMFDRNHQLFNLGSSESKAVSVPGEWFISLMDCLKEVCNKKISELRGGIFDLHPSDWRNTNTNIPKGHEQLDYYQFRINKGDGRVIGIKIENIFYIVWLDPHHNFCDSEGYGKAEYYYRPKTDYEILNSKYNEALETITNMQEEIETYKKVFEEAAITNKEIEH